MNFYKKHYEDDILDDRINSSIRTGDILYIMTDQEFIPPWEEITEDEWNEIYDFLNQPIEEADYTPQPTEQDIINATLLLQQTELQIAIEALRQ